MISKLSVMVLIFAADTEGTFDLYSNKVSLNKESASSADPTGNRQLHAGFICLLFSSFGLPVCVDESLWLSQLPHTKLHSVTFSPQVPKMIPKCQRAKVNNDQVK